MIIITINYEDLSLRWNELMFHLRSVFNFEKLIK